eukprot:GHRQ01039382.1.p3 GENE.GHRQ01039382.1~~GHRQ01039382.1.p3  ORF type:complete len:110 (+),score=23.70 GHRQ01039382.1:117-446(+)
MQACLLAPPTPYFGDLSPQHHAWLALVPIWRDTASSIFTPAALGALHNSPTAATSGTTQAATSAVAPEQSTFFAPGHISSTQQLSSCRTSAASPDVSGIFQAFKVANNS